MSTANELVCNNCGVPHGADDIFCENCGYDFITGSLPGPSEEFTPKASQPAAVESPLAFWVDVGADRNYYDVVVAEGELSFPDPPPMSQTVELSGVELHIGRTSKSKAIHPDIDIAALTGDPAVSARHAVLKVDDDGSITVTDIGSTNGTYIGTPESSSITPGTAVPVTFGTPIFVGAWTRLVLVEPATAQ